MRILYQTGMLYNIFMEDTNDNDFIAPNEPPLEPLPRAEWVAIIRDTFSRARAKNAMEFAKNYLEDAETTGSDPLGLVDSLKNVERTDSGIEGALPFRLDSFRAWQASLANPEDPSTSGSTNTD